MRISIQVKLFLILAGLTVIIVGGVLFALTNTLTTKIEDRIISDFQARQYFFNQQQNMVYDRLVESCYLIGENPAFKANVSLEDPASIEVSVNEMAQFSKVDLFIVTDINGKVLTWLDHPEKQGINLSAKIGVNEALQGIEPEVSIEWPTLWAIDNNIFQVVTLPIYAAGSILGTLSLGSQITRIEADILKGESDIDIHVFLKELLITSTFGDSLSSIDQKAFYTFYTENQALINTTLTNKEASSAFSMQLNDEAVFAFLSPLGIGEPAYYLATIPKSIELQILSVLQQNILLIAIISFLITLLFAFILGKTLTRPILKLVSGMKKASDGDLSVTVKPTSGDEIGLLTQTFNEMINGLRERLHLMKYVGSHTLDMVKNSSSGEVALGGTRKNLTVLFSDIRGFTAFSEERTAEEVIQMLNRFLGFQAEIVTSYGGSVDKFVGDEMVALFMGDDSPEKAIRCAIDIQKHVREENQTDAAGIQVGIGINYGSVIMGNMGAKERMDYTVIGAEVNLGARLCSKAEGNQILIPASVLNRVKMDVQIIQTQNMSFKGIAQELKIVEVGTNGIN
jgi:class 3 adenylate cyclase